MLRISAGTVVSPGCTAMRTFLVGCSTCRSAPAANNELNCRGRLRLAQVMTGPRATTSPPGCQTRA